jgi:NADPH:quinone reductase-like Zn-dependent oxidoreductase
MLATLYHRYGGPEVLETAEIPTPQPKAHEMQLRVHAASVSVGSVIMRTGRHPDSAFFSFMIKLIAGWPKPRKKVLGYEFSGVVTAVGGRVKGYQVGDEVFGTTTGLAQGAYADYVCVPEKWKQGVVAHKPAALSFEEAAALPVGAMTALDLYRHAGLNAGQRVLVYGAAGSVGSAAVQLAKAAGATVTAVCSSRKHDLAKSWGASQVIDYTQTPLAQFPTDFDLILDAVGKISAKELKKLLKPGGKWTSIRRITAEKSEYLHQLQMMVAAGQFRPHLDRVYERSEIRDAHAYVDAGKKTGNVVVRMA